MSIIYVGLGGALGSIFRYLLSLIPIKMSFPLVTFLTNLSGAILIGIVVGISIQRNFSNETILFLKTGFCGGYTTFSTFSLESFALIEKGDWLTAGIYILCSIICCILGVGIGLKLSSLFQLD